MSPLKTLIIDDEPLAQRRLQIVLSEVDGVDVVGTASGRMEARRLVEKHRPDLLLLDIKMRDGTGFDLVDELAEDDLPAIIFVTAFDSYAVRAFDTNAVDYVLKPVERARLQRAVERAREKRASRDATDHVSELKAVLAAIRAEQENPAGRYVSEFWVRRNATGLVRVPVDAIDYVTAEIDYVRLHMRERSYLANETLANLQCRLDPRQFVRVHRSSIVRLAAVREIKRTRVGVLEVHMLSGATLRVGRAFIKGLRGSLTVS